MHQIKHYELMIITWSRLSFPRESCSPYFNLFLTAFLAKIKWKKKIQKHALWVLACLPAFLSSPSFFISLFSVFLCFSRTFCRRQWLVRTWIFQERVPTLSLPAVHSSCLPFRHLKILNPLEFCTYAHICNFKRRHKIFFSL